jgi:hypothetical protein
MPEEEGGMLRQYIPARLDDNQSMLTDDPGYEAKISGMGSAELVRAMREGDGGLAAGLASSTVKIIIYPAVGRPFVFGNLYLQVQAALEQWIGPGVSPRRSPPPTMAQAKWR